MMDDEHERLIALLQRAKRRAAAANPFSPEWDAATAEIEELERLIRDLASRRPTLPLSA